MAVMDRSVTSRTIAHHIESVTLHSVSARTIRRRLQQSGMSARRPLLGLPLTRNHKSLRRQWYVLRSSMVQLISGRMLLYQSTLISSKSLDSIKFNKSSKTSVRLNNKFNGIWSASAIGHVHKISGVNKACFYKQRPLY
ncbi:transposable element Tcb1 transposase [Trichonephila clavipes]|nr:transposable element Tcb1 transposase [Trichonephila clavipes]